MEDKDKSLHQPRAIICNSNSAHKSFGSCLARNITINCNGSPLLYDSANFAKSTCVSMGVQICSAMWCRVHKLNQPRLSMAS